MDISVWKNCTNWILDPTILLVLFTCHSRPLLHRLYAMHLCHTRTDTVLINSRNAHCNIALRPKTAWPTISELNVCPLYRFFLGAAECDAIIHFRSTANKEKHDRLLLHPYVGTVGRSVSGFECVALAHNEGYAYIQFSVSAWLACVFEKTCCTKIADCMCHFVLSETRIICAHWYLRWQQRRQQLAL